MAKKQNAPSTKFADIPGELPKGTVPDDVSLADVAQDAISKLNDLQPDYLTANAIWRDLLAFTGTYRTIHSGQSVLATLQKLGQEKDRSAYSLKDTERRIAKSLDDVSWVDVDISFSTESDGLVGRCDGVVSIVRCADDGKWRIWMLRTWLECFDGQGHPDELEPSRGLANGATNGVTNGHHDGFSNGHDEVAQYDTIIIGGGQSGLSVAGRLEALNVSYVLLEKRPEIGDVWVTRYDSLRWHTSKEYGNLPFGRTYPDEDPYMLPAKRIGAGHKAWAEKYGINARTSTSIDSVVWDENLNTWTVTTSSPSEKQQTIKARNLVLAIGPGHLTPVSPSWASPEQIAATKFKGTIVHGSSYRSAKTHAGKRGIVIGTANTGHDVAEDMADHGMHTTMVQRGSTFIFPAKWLHAAEDLHYHEKLDTAVADKETFTYPNKIMREMINRAAWSGIEADPEPFDALERAGFKVDRFGDIYHNLYVRFGGHYVDVGASARIVEGEIKVRTEAVRSLTENGLVFEDGSEVPADLIVLCTGFDHDFRVDAAKIVGKEVAEQMDEFYGMDGEGEVRGHAKIAGHPHLYYHGGDIRMGRFFSRFIALQIQADVLGKPLKQYLE